MASTIHDQITAMRESRGQPSPHETEPTGSGLTPSNGPDLRAQTLDCGCPAYSRWDIGGVAVEDHACCRCRDAGWLLAPIPASERVRLPANEQITPCPCRRGTPDLTWADQAQIDRHYRGFRLDTWQPGENGAALEVAKIQTEAWPPMKPFFVLMGPVGTGKTALAVAVMYEVWGRHHVRSQFWNAPELAQTLREAEWGGTGVLASVMESLRRYPLLVIDDLGVERDTTHASEQFYRLINARYANEMPTVITTNVELSRLDDRIASRIQDFRLSCVEVLTGPDRRRHAA